MVDNGKTAQLIWVEPIIEWWGKGKWNEENGNYEKMKTKRENENFSQETHDFYIAMMCL